MQERPDLLLGCWKEGLRRTWQAHAGITQNKAFQAEKHRGREQRARVRQQRKETQDSPVSKVYSSVNLFQITTKITTENKNLILYQNINLNFSSAQQLEPFDRSYTNIAPS